MDLPRYVAELRSRGVQFAVMRDRLIVEAPIDALNDEEIAQLRELKPALLEHLRPNPCLDCGDNAGGGVRCSPCAAAAVVGNRPSASQPRRAA